MRHRAIAAAVVAAATLPGASAHAQVIREMTPEMIRTAIAQGRLANRVALPEIMSRSGWAWSSQKPLWGVYDTPFLRVAVASNAAKRRYKEFTEADVTPDLIAPELRVYAFPVALGGTEIANVQTVVITKKKERDRSRAIHPIRTEEVSAEYQNTYGAKVEGKGLTAVFPLDVLREGYEVHVVYDRKTFVGNTSSCDDCSVEFKLDKVR